MSDLALGIDVGGTGIKGALVDTRTGTLLSERIKYPTPPGGEPQDVFQVIGQIVQDAGGHGLCYWRVWDMAEKKRRKIS